MDFDGFDWNDGNWPKCGKHGVSRQEIEAILRDPATRILLDLAHSVDELRELGIGLSPGNSRSVAIIFTRRRSEGLLFVRRISARFMHRKEQQRYEQTRSD